MYTTVKELNARETEGRDLQSQRWLMFDFFAKFTRNFPSNFKSSGPVIIPQCMKSPFMYVYLESLPCVLCP